MLVAGVGGGIGGFRVSLVVSWAHPSPIMHARAQPVVIHTLFADEEDAVKPALSKLSQVRRGWSK
jgi:hypothetical protein